MTQYMNRVIGGDSDLSGALVSDGDGKPVYLEVTVSIGEFEEGTTLLEVVGPVGYQMVCLDFTAAHRLMLALKDAVNVHAEQTD